MKIKDKINAYLNTAISTTVVMVLLGLFFALLPEFAINLLRLLLAAGFLLAGFSMIVSRIYSRFIRMFSSNFLGAFLIVIGLVFLFYPGILSLIPMTIGLVIVISAISRIGYTMELKNVSKSAYITSIITNLLSLTAGVAIIVYPFDASAIALSLIGFIMIGYGLSDLINIIVLKKHVEEFTDRYNLVSKFSGSKKSGTNLDDVEEAEIVDNKKK